MNTTIRDVAKLAGVSVSTVSRAFNQNGRIDDATRERIMALANHLGYRPSAFARGLVLKKTKTILLLAPNIANLYFAEITRAISRQCRDKGFRLLLGDTDEDPAVEAEYLDIIKEGMVDGAIIASLPGKQNIEHFFSLSRKDFPMVFIDSSMALPEFSHVIVDNKLGSEMVIDYFASKGHRRIGFVTHMTEKDDAIYERYEGFFSGHAKNGMEVCREYIETLEHAMERDGAIGADHLLELSEPPTALFAFNDMVAMGCIASAHRHGLRVPEDVAVVGYDDIEMSSYLDLPLTTVALPKEEIARKAVEILLEGIEQRLEEKKIDIRHVVLKPKLIVRSSA